ncbi:MAG: ribosome biogenesis GTPase YqeH [Erysipelotrichaceae bacterium]|nr:ribosome biogenesis GTPase YqeH [Erysipelotrichaceae bacterium]
MNKVIKCFGCGAIIQSENEKNIGYVPKNALEKDHILCQRCFQLKNYHQLQQTNLTKDDYLKLLSSIGDKDCLVVYMIDLFDFHGSLIQGVQRHIGYNDVLVLANKRDVLPKSCNNTKLEHWVRRQLKEEGIKPVDVIITSAKKNMLLDRIYDEIQQYRHHRDVYVIGVTNVGKSTFINALLKHYVSMSDQNLITVSEYPGTTLNFIEIPLDNDTFLYDTPGIVNEHQITHLLELNELKQIIPQSELRPISFNLNSDQTLYFDGLARMDFIKGQQTRFINYFSKNLKIHRCKTVNADDLYNRHMTFKHEIKGMNTIQNFKKYNFHLTDKKSDIVISGLGFVTIHGHMGNLITVYAPPHVNVIMRDALI